MTQQELFSLQKRIDTSADKKDINEINKIILEIENDIDLIDDLHMKTNLYYLLGNCYSELHNIKNDEDNSTIWHYEQKNLFKSIYFYRKSINKKNFEDFELQLKVGLLTNLANSFSHYGRPIEALRYYNLAILEDKKEKVLKNNSYLYPNYFMLLANKGWCFQNYSKIIYDNSHSHLLNKEAYSLFQKAIKKVAFFIENTNYEFSHDYYKGFKNVLESNCTSLEKFYGLDFFNKNENYNEYELSENENESKYQKWCLVNQLYLNPMNDLGNINIATQDILGLPNLKTLIKNGFPIYITYFNQIKQEFIFNRSLLFEGLNNLTKNFYDNNKNIIDDFDYNLFNMNIEKIKIAFRGFYGLFDKIAYLLNEYLNLGWSDRDIDFNKIWKNPNNKKQLSPKLLSLENYAIRGLYLINKDISFNTDEEFEQSLEPHSKDMAKIRNHLEHKFLMVKILNPIGENDRERKYYQITEDDLIEKTIRLAQLTREAIIYTSLAIYIEEEKKDKDELVIEQKLNIYQ